MAKFDKQPLCQKYFFWHDTPSYTCSLYLYLVDINVFAKFDKILSLPGQVIKEKPKCRSQRAITLKELAPSTFFLLQKCSSCRYQCVCKI